MNLLMINRLFQIEYGTDQAKIRLISTRQKSKDQISNFFTIFPGLSENPPIIR